MEHLFTNEITISPSPVQWEKGQNVSAIIENDTLDILNRVLEGRNLSAVSKFHYRHNDIKEYHKDYLFVDRDVLSDFYIAGIVALAFSYRREVAGERDYQGVDKSYWEEIQNYIDMLVEFDSINREKIAVALTHIAARRVAMLAGTSPIAAVSDDDIAHEALQFGETLKSMEHDRAYRFLEFYVHSRSVIFPITLDLNPLAGDVQITREHASEKRYNSWIEQKLGITAEGDIEIIRIAVSHGLDFLERFGTQGYTWVDMIKNHNRDFNAGDNIPDAMILIAGTLLQMTRLLTSIIAIDNDYELSTREQEFIDILNRLDHSKASIIFARKSLLARAMPQQVYSIIRNNRRLIMHRVRADLM